MGITVKVNITGVRQTLAAFRALPKDASAELRDANQALSNDLAGEIRQAAAGSGRQGPAVAPSVKAVRDRVPTVQAGGRRRAGSQSRRSQGQKPTSASDLVFGSNFGATSLRQFPTRTSPDHWFFTTVEMNESEFERRWLDAADTVLERWARG